MCEYNDCSGRMPDCETEVDVTGEYLLVDAEHHYYEPAPQSRGVNEGRRDRLPAQAT